MTRRPRYLCVFYFYINNKIDNVNISYSEILTVLLTFKYSYIYIYLCVG